MYTVVCWFAFVGPARRRDGFAMELNDDPNASVGGGVSFAVFGALFVVVAVFIFRPLFRANRSEPTKGPEGVGERTIVSR